MNKFPFITLSVLSITMAGCASHNMALEDARKSYQSAAQDPTVRDNAPVALHEADQALQQANQAQKDHAKKEDVTHMAFLAKKRVEIARVEAEKKLSEKQLQDVSKDRTDVVISAREKEAMAAREKAEKLETDNKQLEGQAAQTQAQADELAMKNQQLTSELAALKMKPTARGMELTMRDTVFEFGKADLTSGARRDLEKISQELKKAPDRKILIEGHTDSVGADSYNLSLSQRRAEAVKEVLARDIDSSRITAQGLGKQYPVAPNTTEAGRQQNRRVTIVVLPAANNDDAAKNNNTVAPETTK